MKRNLGSHASKGVTKSAEHRAAISAALRGRPFSEQHRANLSLAKTGTKKVRPPGWKKNKWMAHRFIEEQKGRAAAYRCIDCGGAAKDWSYKDPLGFSEDPDDYKPRCVSCHRKYDINALRQAYIRLQEVEPDWHPTLEGEPEWE